MPGNPVPRWRGFNLPEMFIGPGDLRWPEMIRNPKGAFVEREFAWMAEWGFDFVRIPLCYRWWCGRGNPFEIDEGAWTPVDQAVGWAEKYGLHLSLCLHHAPGFCVNPSPEPEPFDLWNDAAAVECFAHHWGYIARRYRAVSSHTLDFDLVNEPTRCDAGQYLRAVSAAAGAIRRESPERMIVIDGLDVGARPCPTPAGLVAAQSCRGYEPFELTHYLAWWGGNSYVRPEWPMPRADGSVFGPRELRARYEPWAGLMAEGTGVLCGEFGVNCRTPHDVTCRFVEDLLGTLGEMGIGWAMWNFRGSFGVLDSSRSDVDYTDWHGLPLDRRLLEILRAH